VFFFTFIKKHKKKHFLHLRFQPAEVFRRPCYTYRAYCFFLWQTFESTGRCVTVSTPNSPTIVARKYRKFGDSPELRQLARDVIRWECRSYPTMQPPPLGYAVKLIGFCTVALPLFRQRHYSLVNRHCHVFLPCDAMRCTVFVIVILSVCLSVCLSVWHTRALCPHGSTYDHDFFRHVEIEGQFEKNNFLNKAVKW